MRRLLHLVRLLVNVALVAAAVWILRDILREYHYREIVRALRTIPLLRLGVSLGLALLSYLALAGYDFVGLRYIGRPFGFHRVLPISFISYAVSNSAPVALLTGGGLRYRLYGSLGLTAFQTAELVAFDVVTYVLGLFVAGGLVFLLEPLAIPGSLHLHFANVHPLGVLFLAVAGGYLLLAILRRRPIRIRSREFHLPGPAIALGQAAVSVLDWTLSCASLYVLLPAAIPASYPFFLGIFLLSQIAALLSPLPGGLGVFEAIVVLLLPAGSPVPGVVGSLLACRVIYYLLPLLAAAALLSIRFAHSRTTGRPP